MLSFEVLEVLKSGYWNQRNRNLVLFCATLIWEDLLPEAAFNSVGKSPHHTHFLSKDGCRNLPPERMKKQSYYIQVLINWPCIFKRPRAINAVHQEWPGRARTFWIISGSERQKSYDDISIQTHTPRHTHRRCYQPYLACSSVFSPVTQWLTHSVSNGCAECGVLSSSFSPRLSVNIYSAVIHPTELLTPSNINLFSDQEFWNVRAGCCNSTII